MILLYSCNTFFNTQSLFMSSLKFPNKIPRMPHNHRRIIKKICYVPTMN